MLTLQKVIHCIWPLLTEQMSDSKKTVQVLAWWRSS